MILELVSNSQLSHGWTLTDSFEYISAPFPEISDEKLANEIRACAAICANENVSSVRFESFYGWYRPIVDFQPRYVLVWDRFVLNQITSERNMLSTCKIQTERVVGGYFSLSAARELIPHTLS